MGRFYGHNTSLASPQSEAANHVQSTLAFEYGLSEKTLREQTTAIPLSLKRYFLSASIDEMKTQKIFSDRHWLTTQAIPDLYEHIRAVRDEFTGQPEISFYHAALIIKICRQIDLDESLRAFRALWNSEGFALLKKLDSRWIVSALDTFADHGEPEEQSNAMLIVTFINMLKMADTEHMLTGVTNYDGERLVDNTNNYPSLWNGIRTFHLPDDDTFSNMIRRMRKVLAVTPLFALIFESLLIKAVHNNTMLTRMAQHHVRSLW